MDSPFSMQMVLLSRRTALVLPQKFRNFRSYSKLTDNQIQAYPSPDRNQTNFLFPSAIPLFLFVSAYDKIESINIEKSS